MKALLDHIAAGALVLGRAQLRAWWLMRRPVVMWLFRRRLRCLDDRLPW